MSNPNVKISSVQILSNDWYTLKKVHFQYKTKDGITQSQSREVYDRGNGAVVLLYNKGTKNIILTKQFRMPTYLNENPDGMMIEAPAGVLDEDDPSDCIKREIEEETGFRVKKVKKLFESYTSPGAVTEILHFFIAYYTSDMKVNEGGGKEDEHEDIEVLEISFQKALDMLHSGEIKDAKTMMLLLYAKAYNNLL
ncbi:NUDIX domain-containing protein [Zhouia amylolytica]|uniref:GDP-mannose pyrophosphatase n=1 Tax=Zhouia amylolytica AD3 TaxID=1286632 RepID=W2USA0_9FLAO|nr:NUDIX domain-containing protein [Zhouia amylolytica]ETN97050.1 nucleoside diphosphate pyrophosphatase [Zhouia amylolytica AD3]